MKEKLKLLGKECLFLLCVTIAAAAADMLQFVGKKQQGEQTSFMFREILYEYNILPYLAGLILIVAFVYYVYTRRFRKTVREFRKETGIMKFLYITLAVLLCMVMFAVLVICALFILGLTGNMHPEALFYLTSFGWPVFTLVFMTAVLFIKEGSLKKVWAKGDEE